MSDVIRDNKPMLLTVVFTLVTDEAHYFKLVATDALESTTPPLEQSAIVLSREQDGINYDDLQVRSPGFFSPGHETCVS